MLSLSLFSSLLHIERLEGKPGKNKNEKERIQTKACRISLKHHIWPWPDLFALRIKQEEEKRSKIIDNVAALNLGEGIAVSSHFVGLFHVEFGELLGLLALS
jgi:hypothetical protein